MGERTAELSSAFTTSGLAQTTGKKTALSGVVLVTPAGAAEAFGVNILRLAAAFADLAAERMKALADI